MIRLDIRWRVIFAPLCWAFGHNWNHISAGTPFDSSGRECRVCARWETFKHEGWTDKPPEIGQAWELKRGPDGKVLGEWRKAKR